MAAAGVDLAFDLTRHSVTGLSDVLRKIFQFRRLLRQLYQLAIEREVPSGMIAQHLDGSPFGQPINVLEQTRSQH